MRVLMRGKRVGVELSKKGSTKSAFLALPEDTNAAGIIRFLGDGLKDSDLRVGMRVYYGDKRHPVTMDGSTILVMDEDNVVAVIEDDANEAPSEEIK